MKITDRDIEIMRWIQEQKIVTEKQVRQVFWKGLTDNSREVNKRLNELRRAGFLTTNKTGLYRNLIYLVTKKGLRQASNGDQVFGEISDTGYSDCVHDMIMTDIRILFHEWGYKEWLSERVLSNRNDLSRVPDAMILNNGKYTAVEYNSSKKSKRRYRKIFIDYELDRQVDNVLYITETPELAHKILKGISVWSKPHFVWIGDIQKDGTNAKLKSLDGECSLRELLETVS